MSKIQYSDSDKKIQIFKDDKLVLFLKKNEFDGFDVFSSKSPAIQKIGKNLEFKSYEYNYHIRIHKKNYSFVIDIDNEEDFNEYVSILSKSI